MRPGQTLHLEPIAPHAGELGNSDALSRLRVELEAGRTDAGWLREMLKERGSLNDVARLQSERWMGVVPGVK